MGIFKKIFPIFDENKRLKVKAEMYRMQYRGMYELAFTYAQQIAQLHDRIIELEDELQKGAERLQKGAE